jgi:four helix bundle protein
MTKSNDLETSKLWKQALNLTKVIEEFVRTIPMAENYTIADPLHRTSITLTSDIAMAVGKGDKDSLFDYRYSRGHLFTIKGLVLVAQELGYSASTTPVLVEVEGLRRIIDAKIAELEENETKHED